MLSGRCLCGGVRFEIEAALGDVIYCHCSMCRRATGSAFASNASVWKDAFRIVAGGDLVREFESSPRHYRAFCSRCGSPLYGRFDEAPEILRVRLGTLDGDPGGRSVAHLHVGSKAPWFEITDGLDLHDAGGPRRHVLPGPRARR